MPWSTATSKQRPEVAWKSRLRRYCFTPRDTRGSMLVAGPNLTIDRTLSIAELRPGEVLRFDRVVVTPGGKGLNVGRAARALGHPAVLVSLLPGRTGEAAAALIADLGVELHAVPCGGELRSTAIIQERDGRTTVLNEPGPPVERPHPQCPRSRRAPPPHENAPHPEPPHEPQPQPEPTEQTYPTPAPAQPRQPSPLNQPPNLSPTPSPPLCPCPCPASPSSCPWPCPCPAPGSWSWKFSG